MENGTSRSNQGLYYSLLALMLLPILNFIWEVAYYSTTPYGLDNNSWPYINPLISIGFIILVAKRKFGILLFLIIPLIISTIYLFINAFLYTEYQAYVGITTMIIDLSKVASLVLMFILLDRESNRYFNLQFSTTEITLPKTYQLIRVFNVTFLVIGGLIILFLLMETDFNPIYLVNEYILLYLVAFVTTIIGTSNKSKLLNLGFALIVGALYILFRKNGYRILAPFTENDSTIVTQAIILDFLLVTFGIFLIVIVRTYFQEKPVNTKLKSNPELLDILD